MQLAFDKGTARRIQEFKLPGGLRAVGSRIPRRFLSILTVVFALSPTMIGAVYYGLIATDRYVSEAQFVVRSATRTSGAGGFAAFLQMVGISRSQDDTFSVHDFISSRDAVIQLSEQLPLREIYRIAEADALSRYPNIFYGSTVEQFHRYLKGRIEVIYNSNTGISTLKVQAFRPEDATQIADHLLRLGEQLINQMNVRIREDSVRFAADEVKRAEERTVSAQLAITDFRNREVTLDPTRSSIHVMELVARLSGELSTASALLAEVTASSPSSPQLPALQRRVQAIQEQIAIERARISNTSDGLAQKIAQFEQLSLEREFANKALAAAITALDGARSEARRQQLYLERVAGPSKPDQALKPERFFLIATILAVNLIALMIIWLFVAGMRMHAPIREF